MIIERSQNEAANVELIRRGLASMVRPSGEIPGEAIIFVNSISLAQWRWPEGVPDPAPPGWPAPYNAEIPDYVDIEVM